MGRGGGGEERWFGERRDKSVACAGGVGWGHREYVRYSVGLGRALTRLVESAAKLKRLV